MSTIAPERSLEQRMSALELANDVRYWRAEQKRLMKAGDLLLVDLLVEIDERLESMKVCELLGAVPGMGPGKVEKCLRWARVSHSKTVGGMTERQWGEVIRWLGMSGERVRLHALGS